MKGLDRFKFKYINLSMVMIRKSDELIFVH